MKIELTRNEYRVLLTALDRMDDDHHNCQGDFAYNNEGPVDSPLDPTATSWCAVGHILASAAYLLGDTNEASSIGDTIPMKLEPLAVAAFPSLAQDRLATGGIPLDISVVVANDLYGTAAVRDAVRRGIAKGEIVVAAA